MKIWLVRKSGERAIAWWSNHTPPHWHYDVKEVEVKGWKEMDDHARHR